MNVGIVGASGYSGEELVRLLARHPQVNLHRVTSRSLAGKPVVQELPRLRGAIPHDLCFTASHPETLAADEAVPVWFLALPHGVASEFARPLVEAGRLVLDLSADFRLNSAKTYADYYGHEHPAPDLLQSAPYVIPELAVDEDWKRANLLACPGCYPTSILLGLVPLLRAGLISRQGIVINSFSGVSGAGKKRDTAFSYVERSESAKAYGMPRHRHLSEVEEQLSEAARAETIVQFNPHLAPMRRGIITTTTAPAPEANAAELEAALRETYADTPFVTVLPSGQFPDSAHIAGTNHAQVSVTADERTGNAVITSAIDNLLKGASGQAVQLMNLRHSFDETNGLL